MATKATKKNKKKSIGIKEAVKKLNDIQDFLNEFCDDYALLGKSKEGGMIDIIQTRGDEPVEMVKNYEKLLLYVGLLNMVGEPNKDGHKIKITLTQGKLNLAYCMLVDMLDTVIGLGAEDYADLKEEIVHSGFDWVEEDDILEAYNDDKDILMKEAFEEDEDEDDGDDDKCCQKDEDSDTTLIAPKNLDQLAEVLGAVFDVSPKTMKKVLETEGKDKSEVKCFAKKFSKSEADELKKVLDKLEESEE